MQKDSPRISKALERLKISLLNEMQQVSLEAHQQDKDVILLAPTGSGKTLAFLLPILTELEPNPKGIQALVLAPSRELALQIEDVFRKMETSFKVNCFYGGHDFKIEKNSLREPPALLIGTPGRIADHLRRGTFQPASIQRLILDEFDKSLEFGFQTEMAFIKQQLIGLKRLTLTSATRPTELPDFLKITRPIELDFLTNTPPQGLTLKQVVANGNDKLDALFRLICKIGNESTLIFYNHREAVERISSLPLEQDLAHDIYHGGLEQDERERALIKFRNGSIQVLITTDLGSRGLDIPQIKNVVHYQLPPSESAFIHRNGRTARMHAEGTAFLIVSENEPLPPYLTESLETEDISQATILPNAPEWTTLYFAAGKKEKISKTDIVGLLLQKGNLKKEELGLIEVKDHSSFAAVKREKAEKLIKLLLNEKIKQQKVKIDLSR